MRQLLVLLAASALTGCTSTVMAEPVFHASPYLALYQLRGDIALQSAGGQDNPAVPMETFGHGRRRDDVGLRAAKGAAFVAEEGCRHSPNLGLKKRAEKKPPLPQLPKPRRREKKGCCAVGEHG